ncbi:hypothetical protein GJV85_08915 [Sulfurimonas aquatica]|uniref:Fibronectin type-III domain-containing protein n=1 Tax=Sulfurimonas aquatica TaxID=2672570 RepID=A0A975B174_9BACT|nr:fibronectin type III domain-containing protein [Sulfurimonas aquatica]QSZ42228.1 hypothetical protein GJV85_08915 [Sulfurimonas aquatica]
MKLWIPSTLLTASLLILSGCGTSPKPEDIVVIDTTLPIVELTQNGIITDMNAIAFEWKNIQDPRVNGIYVYKKSPSYEGQSSLVHTDTIEGRFKTHYVDSNVEPDTKYSYMFKTFTQDSQSEQSQIVSVNSLPVLQSVAWIHSITGMPRTAKLIWRPHINEKVKEYIVERKTLEEETWSKLSVVKGRLNAEFIDDELNDNYVYMYRLRAVTFDGIISTPSQIVKVITKALPKSIENIKTTINLPKRIQINWDESTTKDFKLYYLYRSESVDGSYELIATLHNNIFIDKIEEDGRSYFYRVSAVDKDDLESEHEKNSIAGMTLPKPLAPAIVEAQLLGSKIELKWSKTDSRSKTFVIRKKHKKGWFDETQEEFEGIVGNTFIDTNILPDSTYRYMVYSLDENKIKSEASVEVKIVTPESTEIQKAPIKKVKDEVVSEYIPEPVAASKEEAKDIISVPEELDLSGL